MKRQGLLSVTGILLLGLIVLMTLHEWGNPLNPEERQAFLSSPVIIAENITAISYTTTGEMQYHLVADHLEQYDRPAKTLLTRPRLRVNNDQGTWTIHSQQGEVRNNGNLILFENQVQVHSDARDITLKTDKLRYHSDTRIVETPATVHMSHLKSSTRAGSLWVDLDTGEMKLKQGVVSDYRGPKP